MTSIKKVDERYKENLAALNPQLNSAVSASDAAYKRQSDAISSIYEGQITESGVKYDDLARSNDIQKLINEREVAENMANLGLTDSGLNRTQQTAVILSHSNERSRIAREKQSMVDYLKRELTAKLSDIEASRASAEASIRSGYEKQAMDAAVSSYNTDVDAWQKNYEAGIKAAQEAAKKAAEMTHGFTSAQVNKLSDYLSKKDYVSAENYLDIYGDTLSDSDLKYWFSLFPTSYLNGDRELARRYGDANEDGAYDIRDMVRAKKKSASASNKLF